MKIEFASGPGIEIQNEHIKNISDLPLAPQVPLTGLVDEFGFETSPGEKNKEISPEDFTLVRYLLEHLQEHTNSNGIHRVLTDLLERLGK